MTISRTTFAPISMSASQGALAGALSGAVIGAVSVVAAVIGRGSAVQDPVELLVHAVALTGLGLGVLGAIVGALVGLVLAIGGWRFVPARLSTWYLVVTLVALPLAVAYSLQFTLLDETAPTHSRVGLLAAATIVGMVVAWRARRTADAAFRRIGPREARVLGVGAPLLLLVLVLPFALVVASPTPTESLAAAAGSAAPSADADTPVDRPNVLLITVDTLRADRLGSYGNPTAQTPHLDRLAAEGARFSWAFVQQPNTNAQHASIFTGTYPATHGVRSHMVDRLPAHIPTLAELLRDHGYVTAGIYSWISLEPAFSGFHRGFDTYQGVVLDKPAMLANRRLQSLAAAVRRVNEYVPLVRIADLLLNAGDGMEERMDGRGDLTTDAALVWLRQGHRPFFLWVHYFDPHYPYSSPSADNHQPDPEYDGAIDGTWSTIRRLIKGSAISDRDAQHLLALYDGEVSFVDTQIGRLLAALEEENLLDDTVVILTADHGESLGEHDAWFHPTTVYNTEVRVPLLIRYPPVVAPRAVDAPAQGIDVMPTVLDLVGVPIPPTVEGKSLASLVRADPVDADHDAFSQLPDDRLLAVVRSGWKLILDRESGTIELYDLANDPNETWDRAHDRPDVASELEDHLRRWMAFQRLDP